MGLLDDIADALKRDQNLEFSDLRGLINAFRRVDPAKIQMYTVPVVSDRRRWRVGAGARSSRVRTAVLEPADVRDSGRRVAGSPRHPPRCTWRSERNRRRRSSAMRSCMRSRPTATTSSGPRPRPTAATTRRHKCCGGGARTPRVSRLRPHSERSTARSQAEPLPAGVDVLVIVGRDWDELPAAVKLPPVADPPEQDVAPGRPRPRPSTIATTTTTTPGPVVRGDGGRAGGPGHRRFAGRVPLIASP